MKKIIASVLACIMLLGTSFVFAETPLSGGWSVALDCGITDDSKAVFDKAIESLLGVSYEPIAYLGSQVVAGLNHCFLARATVIYPDALPTLVLVYIYQDLQGACSITHIQDLDIAALSIPAEIEAE